MSDLNDPRVFFAAERTLLAWSRTSLTLTAFGFVIERFGLFVSVLLPNHGHGVQRGFSFWVGFAFVLLGAGVAAYSTLQFRQVLKTLKPVEIPDGYRSTTGVWINLAIALLGVAILIYLFSGI